MAHGEGWHNYHHAFPWDYKAAELPTYNGNLTTALIDLFAKLGWAYDLKTVSEDMIKRKVQRTGDGSHKYSKEVNSNDTDKDDQVEENVIWGWDDPDITAEEKSFAEIRLKSE